jgi:hypothetical protein
LDYTPYPLPFVNRPQWIKGTETHGGVGLSFHFCLIFLVYLSFF